MKRRSAIFIGVLGALLLLVGAWVLLPTSCGYTTKSRNSESLVSLSPLRAAIAERAEQKQSLADAGSDLDVEQYLKNSKSIHSLHVTSDGVIIFRTAQGSVMTLIPALEQGKVAWQCVGGPPGDVPAVCRTGEFLAPMSSSAEAGQATVTTRCPDTAP